jgi:hypothetical protein
MAALWLMAVTASASASSLTHQEGAHLGASTRPTLSAPHGKNEFYANHEGALIHRPERTADKKAPPGATAQCRDGTYSFSKSRSGTCSRHGGVAGWL